MMNADKVRPVLCRILEFLRKARSCGDDAGQAGGGARGVGFCPPPEGNARRALLFPGG